VLDEAVGQCRLAVVDMRDDGKIADMLHGKGRPAAPSPFVKAAYFIGNPPDKQYQLLSTRNGM
jgi:hypothetical protein